MTAAEHKPVTRSIMLQTLCTPCANFCRYCLLSWNGRVSGADWDRSAALAKRFSEWMKKNRPELKFDFAFGCSMEHPKLIEAVDFLNSIGSVMGRFLQLDGMRMRTDPELDALFSSLSAHGVEHVDFTFYGTEAYHDRFAARRGDHELMLRSIRFALAAHIAVTADMPLTGENIGMANSVVDELRRLGCGDIRFRIPHGEGRGALLEPVRLKISEFEALEAGIRPLLNRAVFKTEGEWLDMAQRGELAPESNRSLLISLTPQNIGEMEAMQVERIISEAERLDEEYYAAFPDFAALAETYGDKNGERLFSRRDLFHYYRKSYALEHGVKVYDVTDETQTGSRRY